MSDEETYADFATVRDLLLDAEGRRKQLTYEQTAALQHAEWAASEQRMGYKTDPKVYQDLLKAVLEIDVFQGHDDLAAVDAGLEVADGSARVMGRLDDLAADGGLQRNLELVTVDLFSQLLEDDPAADLGV